jgi:hypothetical protein
MAVSACKASASGVIPATAAQTIGMVSFTDMSAFLLALAPALPLKTGVGRPAG